MSPRKSSTSSANLLPRPRYLGLEVAGVPLPSPRALEQLLVESFERAGEPRPNLRVIRHAGPRVIVEVSQFVAPVARRLWNATLPRIQGGPVTVRTERTWGTLRKGKGWSRERGRSTTEPRLPNRSTARAPTVRSSDPPGKV